MCTVTFIPTRNGRLLSSNRDENPLRKKALLPSIINTKNGELVYPTDGLAAGTWIGARNSGVVIVMLNGAAGASPCRKSYSRSRGLVVKQMLGSDDPHDEWKHIDLANVAAFTLVVVHQSSLVELSWNGKEKHAVVKNPDKPHIWSSSTLYDATAIKKREHWFTSWLKKNIDINSESLYKMLNSFNDDQDGFVINRNDTVRTLSISLIEILHTSIHFSYFDLLNNTVALLTIDLNRKLKGVHW